MTDIFCNKFLATNGWAPFDVPDSLLNDLNNVIDSIDFDSTEIINPNAINATYVHDANISSVMQCKEFNLIHKKYISTNFFSSLKLTKAFYVYDSCSTINRNQSWHFDALPKFKIILGLSGIDSDSSTKFLNGSHKSIYSLLNSFFLKITKGRLQIAKYGCKNLPFFDKLCKQFLVGNNFQPSRSIVFNTNCIHSAGIPINGIRQVLILHFESR